MIFFFDIGATLIEGPAQTPARQIAAALGWADVARKKLDQLLLTRPVLSPEALAALLVTDFATPPAQATRAAAQAWESQLSGPQTIDGGPQIIAALRQAGLRVGFISNIWFPYAISFARLYGEDLAQPDCILSFREGIAKPDPALYLRALQRCGVSADQALMIGDSHDNDIAPAQAVGLKTLWLRHRLAKEQDVADAVAAGRLPPPTGLRDHIRSLTVPLLTDLLHAPSA